MKFKLNYMTAASSLSVFLSLSLWLSSPWVTKTKAKLVLPLPATCYVSILNHIMKNPLDKNNAQRETYVIAALKNDTRYQQSLSTVAAVAVAFLLLLLLFACCHIVVDYLIATNETKVISKLPNSPGPLPLLLPSLSSFFPNKRNKKLSAFTNHDLILGPPSSPSPTQKSSVEIGNKQMRRGQEGRKEKGAKSAWKRQKTKTSIERQRMLATVLGWGLLLGLELGLGLGFSLGLCLGLT